MHKLLFSNTENLLEEIYDPLFEQKKVVVYMLRLDKIHPIVSGNKLFKLYYFLEKALETKHKTIVTFGGAYSNHLVATAYACKALHLNCIGIVRGEKSNKISHTLQQCADFGMQLYYLNRREYRIKENVEFENVLQNKYGEFILVPEGGYSPIGAMGAALIKNKILLNDVTHICTAVGTATTLAGLLLANANTQTMVQGIVVLKGMHDMDERIHYLTNKTIHSKLQVFDKFHFGGYAKKNNELIHFINSFWLQHKLALDFVYTAKMMYAVYDGIKNNIYPKGSKIVCLHTGGLQGNKSLKENSLVF